MGFELSDERRRRLRAKSLEVAREKVDRAARRLEQARAELDAAYAAHQAAEAHLNALKEQE